MLRQLLQQFQNASILEQGCAGFSSGSANRKHQITRHPCRASPPLRPSLSFRYTQGPADPHIDSTVRTPLPARSSDIAVLISESGRIAVTKAARSSRPAEQGAD